MLNKCCSEGCGEYCGGALTTKCNEWEGGTCCGGEILDTTICGKNGQMAPCTILGRILPDRYHFT